MAPLPIPSRTPSMVHLAILFYAFFFLLLAFFTVSKKTVVAPSDIPSFQPNIKHAAPVSKRQCLGYRLENISHTPSGLKAKLNLIGEPCHAFDQDIADLTLEVVYETENRLHVHIYDTSQKQFQIPVQVFPLPNDIIIDDDDDERRVKERSSLAFEYSNENDSSRPFEFWIRRTDGSNDIIFDTRQFPLIFERQYLQISSHLPENANIFGLGEYIASSGFRRDPFNTTQTFWTRDQANPVDENEYAGPTPTNSIEQYVQLVGLPQLQPYWAFGFHLLRWGYNTVDETRETVLKMRESNIPLEVSWNDIDYMLDYRNFELASSSDENNNDDRFPIKKTKSFISELHQNHQYYIPIIDAAIHKVDPNNQTDIYNVYSRGSNLKTFLSNPDGSEYIGKVWPGYTVFPDWFAKNTQNWWTEAFRNFSKNQVDFDGIWLDMNEPSSFCEGSCGSQINSSSQVGSGMILPGEVGNLVTDYPEGYNPDLWGPSGNLTTQQDELKSRQSLQRRDIKSSNFQFPVDSKIPDIPDKYLNTPGYSIHNGDGPLNVKTVSVNATHQNGLKVYHTHNLWGHMEAIATHKALLEIHPNRRPFIVSRSTFAGGGRKTAHWLGDNYSTWTSMRYSIQGVLQFQAFGIPMIGPDTCGFNGNTSEELCNRWMMLSAFYPFYRNHNIKGSISQEPYVWDSVAEASRIAISIRYRLLPYFYSEMAQASIKGTPPIKALFWEFPNDMELLKNDQQFMFGRAILVSPVLKPNVTRLDVTFPGDENEIWRDWYTFKEVDMKKENKEGATAVVNLPAPISHINLHIRGGSILLLHSKPAYTTYETREGPFELIISLDRKGNASSKDQVYLDDGISYQHPNDEKKEDQQQKTAAAYLEFNANSKGLKVKKSGNFKIQQKLEKVTILGMKNVNFGISQKTLSPSSLLPTKLEVNLKIHNNDNGINKILLMNRTIIDNDNDTDDVVDDDDVWVLTDDNFVFDLNESSWELIW